MQHKQRDASKEFALALKIRYKIVRSLFRSVSYVLDYINSCCADEIGDALHCAENIHALCSTWLCPWLRGAVLKLIARVCSNSVRGFFETHTTVSLCAINAVLNDIINFQVFDYYASSKKILSEEIKVCADLLTTRPPRQASKSAIDMRDFWLLS